MPQVILLRGFPDPVPPGYLTLDEADRLVAGVISEVIEEDSSSEEGKLD